MSQPPESTRRAVEPVDPESLEDRLRNVVLRLFTGREFDELELRHLSRVITECSLLLTDVYSDERISRIMDPGRAELARLVTGLKTIVGNRENSPSGPA
jgi:hypothetical protein